jgi:hypothetical protein
VLNEKVSQILINQGFAIFCCSKNMCAGYVQHPITDSLIKWYE